MNGNAADTHLLADLIRRQRELDEAFRHLGILDLVADFGELIAARALGVAREKPVTRGHDILHPVRGKVQVKTRRMTRPSATETRAVFRPDAHGRFAWLMHIVLNHDYSVRGACLATHDNVWASLKGGKIRFEATQRLQCAEDWTEAVRAAAAELLTHGTR